MQRPDRARGGLISGSLRSRVHVPQLLDAHLSASVAELERCVGVGFIGCNLSPDSGGGRFQSSPLTGPYWFPVYKKLVERMSRR